MTLIRKILAAVSCLVFFTNALTSAAAGADESTVRSQIDQKNQQLQQISQQIQEQQQKLAETQNQKQSISSEIKKIDSGLNEINLNIQASQVTIDKLGLESQSLQDNISIAENDIAAKQEALKEVLKQIQDKDSESVLYLFLKNKTLSDGIFESQSLADMNSTLLVKINELNQSKQNLNDLLDQTNQNKQQKEVEKGNLQNQKSIASDLRNEKSQFLQETKNKEKVYQDSLTALQKQQMAIADEIEKMESGLRSQINFKNLPKNMPGFLIMPVSGAITQGYGATNFAKSAYKGKWHNGIDIAAPIGTPIYAAKDGLVVAVDNQDKYCYKGAYGKYVAIKHYVGLTTIYGHMSLSIVSEGQQVKQGQIIGYVGKTGYATGPHVHFTVYDSETFRIGPSNSCGPKMPYGGDLNPLNYLSV